ncbi:UNVERIFIED_CONTAM: hypothetical protein NCL1_50616 [Trichonephila clavipes]
MLINVLDTDLFFISDYANSQTERFWEAKKLRKFHHTQLRDQMVGVQCLHTTLLVLVSSFIRRITEEEKTYSTVTFNRMVPTHPSELRITIFTHDRIVNHQSGLYSSWPLPDLSAITFCGEPSDLMCFATTLIIFKNCSRKFLMRLVVQLRSAFCNLLTRAPKVPRDECNIPILMSRLGCQIRLAKNMEGMEVGIEQLTIEQVIKAISPRVDCSSVSSPECSTLSFSMSDSW